MRIRTSRLTGTAHEELRSHAWSTRWHRRSRLLLAVTLLVAATGALLVGAGPVGAATGPTPFVDCIVQLPSGLIQVYYGYTNAGPSESIPVGDDNQIFPGVQNQGQPTHFNLGTYPRVFVVTYNPFAFNSEVWALNGQSAVATTASVPCSSGVTEPASALTPGSATLNGAVDPEGEATTWHFEYGTSTVYTLTTPDQTTSATQVGAVHAPVSGLGTSSTYHYRLVSTNGTATTNGADEMFTTLAPAALTADLSLTKVAAAATANVGQQLTYTLTATNKSSGTATGVTVSDPLPGGSTFVSASTSQGSCSSANQTVTCPVGALAGLQSATVTIVVTPTQAGTLTNTGVVGGDQADPNHANDFQVARTNVATPPPAASTRASTQAPRFTG
jgi:uncharacterized repeat protein (TIGR01451 family)